ncbi:2382_t:CDS:1 [Diversispora eburnea]|uniref:2382_t:CDS:1 n=1 Tax=Diversispora eburnea TaxID=1213867 RepID=A0A9N9ARF4_9GLOM|nr:2382_t:CDS:1 [Diversispora eburnea]
MSLLENPPMNAQDIIRYMRGNKSHISGKNAFFLQLEYLKIKSIIHTTTTDKSLKELCNDIWISASPDQRRKFDVLANKVNNINKKLKKRHFHKRPNNNNNYVTNQNSSNSLAFDLINGIRFP